MQPFFNICGLKVHNTKMMKQILLFTIFLSLSVSGMAQEIDARLSTRYSANELADMNQNDPAKLTLLNYALDHACYIADVPKGKESSLNGVIEMNINEPIDFMALGLEIQKTNQYLRISGTDKVLVVKSEWVLTNEMQNKQ
jgi:hypothetical protein